MSSIEKRVCDGCNAEIKRGAAQYALGAEKLLRRARIVRVKGGRRKYRRMTSYASIDLCTKCARRPIALSTLFAAVVRKDGAA